MCDKQTDIRAKLEMQRVKMVAKTLQDDGSPIRPTVRRCRKASKCEWSINLQSQFPELKFGLSTYILQPKREVISLSLSLSGNFGLSPKNNKDFTQRKGSAKVDVSYSAVKNVDETKFRLLSNELSIRKSRNMCQVSVNKNVSVNYDIM